LGERDADIDGDGIGIQSEGRRMEAGAEVDLR